MNKQTFFITGTDTEVGKTWVCQQLLQNYHRNNLTTTALKPIAAGAINTPNGLRNEDGLTLQRSISLKIPYEQVNPICLQTPCSPHLAAELENKNLDIPSIIEKSQPLLITPADVTLIEGAGGWFAPITYQETMADLAAAYQVPIILVVGIRLGCLNHALLTAQAIQHSPCTLHGWIANCLEPNTLFIQQNIQTLTNLITAPLLNIYSYSQKI